MPLGVLWRFSCVSKKALVHYLRDWARSSFYAGTDHIHSALDCTATLGTGVRVCVCVCVCVCAPIH